VQVSGSYSREVHGVSNSALAAARRSAERRKCPKCERKSALRSVSNDFAFGTACRWSDCGYENLTARDA
jgi:hypothetical protein